jgi:hypothetical protein
MVFAENDYMVQTFAPDGADQPFHVGRLPRAMWGCHHFLVVSVEIEMRPAQTTATAPAFFHSSLKLSADSHASATSSEGKQFAALSIEYKKRKAKAEAPSFTALRGSSVE